jgi:hypothetical protein
VRGRLWRSDEHEQVFGGAVEDSLEKGGGQRCTQGLVVPEASAEQTANRPVLLAHLHKGGGSNREEHQKGSTREEKTWRQEKYTLRRSGDNRENGGL